MEQAKALIFKALVGVPTKKQNQNPYESISLAAAIPFDSGWRPHKG